MGTVSLFHCNLMDKWAYCSSEVVVIETPSERGGGSREPLVV